MDSLLVKTKGWLLSAGTIADVKARADWWADTQNGRFAWAERNKTELTGVAKDREVIFPGAWSVQEIVPPEGWMMGAYKNDPNDPDPELAIWLKLQGMPWYCEIHDIWSTVEITDQELGLIAGEVNNEQYGPSMLGNAQVTTQNTFLDFEQVIAARSRVWFPGSHLFDYSKQSGPAGSDFVINAEVRQQFAAKVHDNQWGSAEPIATLDLYHVRVMITNVDRDSAGYMSGDPESPITATPLPGTGFFCTMPSSNQPMTAVRTKPDFLSRMTMERRSKGV